MTEYQGHWAVICLIIIASCTLINSIFKKEQPRIRMTTIEMRELDAWIAEHVFGLRHENSPSKIVPGTFSYQRGGEVLKFYHGNQLEIFNPTTDPAAAFKVLQKCQEERIISLHKNRISSLGKGEEKAIAIEAETIELAICKFARMIFTK